MQVQASQVNWATHEAVICRYNVPLLKLGLELLHRGLPVMLNGRQLAEAVTRLAREALPETFSAAELTTVLRTLRATQNDVDDDTPTARAEEHKHDLINSLEVLAQQTCQATGHGSLDALMQQLQALSQPGGIELSTIHRAEGREWPRVTLLDAEHFVATLANGDATREESCVLFVALTRAKSRLTLAYGDVAWEEQIRLLPTPNPANARLPQLPRKGPEAPASSVQITDPLRAPRIPLPKLSEPAITRIQTTTTLLEECPLYSGNDPISASKLRERLGALCRSGRPTFQRWAEEAVQHLLVVPEEQLIAFDAQVLRCAEQHLHRTKIAIPVIGGLNEGELSVLLTEGGLARWKAVQRLPTKGKVVRVRYGQETWSFGPHGELHARPFHPEHPYLRL